jgi:hypothetical protein
MGQQSPQTPELADMGRWRDVIALLLLPLLSRDTPRTPEKWLPLARDYLRIATADAVHLERMLRTRADR